MSGSSKRRRNAIIAVASVAAAMGGTYLAERRAVARWRAGVDPHRDEPHTIVGDTRWADSSDGARLRVVEAGTGPTVILAHGFTAALDHWAPVARRLIDRGLRVVAFDQRGHASSTAGSERFTTTHLGDDLAAVLAATAPDGAVVAGHSMGGIGIQAMLADHPEVVETLRGIVLVSTVARPVSVPLGELMGKLGGTALARKTMEHDVHGRILARGGVGVVPAITVIDVVRGGWISCPDDTRAGVMRDLRDFDFSDTLAAVSVPTTVICGDRDQVTPLEESRRIVELMPDARLDVVTGAGHAVPWEAPDRVADAIIAHALVSATSKDN